VTKPLLGVCYYPEHWDEARWVWDAAKMVEAGISHVRIGEFAWSRIEPEPGRIDLEWLDRAIETLASAGLKIVLGTPTATPPKWLVDDMPSMLAVDAEGRPRRFGSRRHYCFSHEGYRRQCARIVEILANRYGNHPAITAWQTDNEYGCHDTVESYSEAAKHGFREWLSQKYQSPQALNRAWGNVFWSMEYRSFEEVELPNLTVTEANPSHRLDFQRYSSDKVVSFNALQAGIIRRLSPGRDIVHNFMGWFTAFDHFAVSDDLDVAAWDSYPIGFLDRDQNDPERRKRYMRVGDPDAQAFHHDLYRGCGHGRLWIMEQQPGPVNWAPHNPAPAKGAVRLWTWEAFAAGAELVSYFRWRQAPFAQEQMHEALLLPDSTLNEAWFAARDIAREIEVSAITIPAAKAAVALVFDYESAWAHQIQPQAASFTYLGLIMDVYRALRANGLSVDIVRPRPGAAAGYHMVVAPALFSAPEDFMASLDPAAQIIVLGPRTGAKTADFAIPATLPPGPAIQQWLDFKVRRIDSLPEHSPVPLTSGGHVKCWREFIMAGDDITLHATTADGEAFHVSDKAGRVHYITGWADAGTYTDLYGALARLAGLKTARLHPDIRLRDQGELRFVFNHGPETLDIAALVQGYDVLIGTVQLPPCGVMVAHKAHAAMSSPSMISAS
jgi:beta-galactosidase